MINAKWSALIYYNDFIPRMDSLIINYDFVSENVVHLNNTIGWNKYRRYKKAELKFK